jgi:opacity protein-like surface antigen
VIVVKKVSMLIMVCLLVLGLVGSVAAAAPVTPNQNPNQAGWNCPYWGQQQANLTEAQKQDLIAYQNQVLESRKQLMQKQVD